MMKVKVDIFMDIFVLLFIIIAIFMKNNLLTIFDFTSILFFITALHYTTLKRLIL